MSGSPEWGPGPWNDEPDELRWQDARTGLWCKLLRNSMLGILCGYVGVPPGHALFGWDYHDSIKSKEEYNSGTAPIDLAFQVHGGLSYSGENNGLWWFGFDCGHAWDLVPSMVGFYRKHHLGHDRAQTYRDISFVKHQCADLAFQLKQLEAAKELTTAKDWHDDDPEY